VGVCYGNRMPTDVRRLVRARALLKSGSGRAIRESAGLGLNEFSRLINVPPSDLSHWERGLNVPRVDSALLWLAAIEDLQS
jgi:DNA-binding transcriptional regulator YiaG